MKIETREKFPNFVGFVSAIDLKKELNDELVKKIDHSINKLSVLVFKNQNINDNEQVRFTKYFGKIEMQGFIGILRSCKFLNSIPIMKLKPEFNF